MRMELMRVCSGLVLLRGVVDERKGVLALRKCEIKKAPSTQLNFFAKSGEQVTIKVHLF